MAIVLVDSFNRYGGNETQGARVWAGGGTKFNNTHVYTGSWAIGNSAGENYGRAIAPKTNTLICGFWVYWTGAAPFLAMVMYTTGGNYNGSNDQVILTADTSHRLLVKRGGTTIDTSAACLNSGAFNYIEAKIFVDNSGTYVVKCNGATVLSGSADTQAGSTNTVGGISIGSNAGYWIEDLYVLDSSGASNNDFLGRTAILGSNAQTGDGADGDFTPSSGSDNGAMVDDAVANDDTDYNSSSTVGHKDTYTFDLSALSGRTKYAAQVTLCAKATSAGANYVYAIARESGGTETLGPPRAVSSAAYAYIEEAFD